MYVYAKSIKLLSSAALIFLPPALHDTNIPPLSVDVFKKYGSVASLTLSKDDVGDMVHVCMYLCDDRVWLKCAYLCV